MKKILTLVLATVFVCSAFAQNSAPPAPPSPADRAQRHVKFLTTVLSLTSAQEQQALTTFTDAATAENQLHESMRSAHDVLKSAETSGDTAAIDQAAKSIGQLMAQLISTSAKANAAFYQTLTQKQQSKLSELQSMGHGHGGHGMGGPDHGFGGPMF